MYDNCSSRFSTRPCRVLAAAGLLVLVLALMLVLVMARMLIFVVVTMLNMLVVARMLILVVALMLVFVVALCYDRPRLSFWGKLFAHPNVDFNNTTLLKRTVASWTNCLR